MSVLNLLVFNLLVISLSECARILAVFPVPSISHQVVFRPLTQELAKRGHEVVVITTDPAFPKGGTPPNLTEIDVHDISYNIWKKTVITASKGKSEALTTQIEVGLKAVISVVDLQLKDAKVQNILQDKTQNFDLILSEACARSALIYSHIYKVPVIQVSSLGATIDNYEVIGASIHYLLYPTMIRQKINKLSTWEKITELYNLYKIHQIYENMKVLEDNMIANNVEDILPSIDELNNNVHMLFLNVHPLFEGIRPVPPTVVYMGGLHQKSDKQLPTDLKSYLDSSKHGVIYISFGTNVDPSLLPVEKIQTLVNTVARLPYDVLWKWNTDELPGRTNNIKISKWLPQSDLLKHPKIKLFITQGGLQSTDEAITAGVPLIGIPMFADQWFNVENYESHKIGIRVDMESLTEERMTKAISTIINDKSYRDNIVKLRELMDDEPMRPLERAVWWTEYVLRHGGAKHLRSPVANITWTQYLELELVYTVCGVLIVALIVFILALRSVYSFINNMTVKIKCN